MGGRARHVFTKDGRPEGKPPPTGVLMVIFDHHEECSLAESGGRSAQQLGRPPEGRAF